MTLALAKILDHYGADSVAHLCQVEETQLMDSVQDAFCVTCGEEHDGSLEPDGFIENGCEHCGGHVKSLTTLILF